MGSKDKILKYYRTHLNEWTHNQKLRVISGANDTPRTIRQLRQEGWQRRSYDCTLRMYWRRSNKTTGYKVTETIAE